LQALLQARAQAVVVMEAFLRQRLARLEGEQAQLQRDQGFQVDGQGHARHLRAGAFDSFRHLEAHGVPLAGEAHREARAQVGFSVARAPCTPKAKKAASATVQASGTMRSATAAADPLEEPPGVWSGLRLNRPGSCGGRLV
jgi:hypothetical protein